VTLSFAPEIGWSVVESVNRSLVPGGRWFQWHDDGWTRPRTLSGIARHLSASQAFR
jgi:hypothetical protein